MRRVAAAAVVITALILVRQPAPVAQAAQTAQPPQAPNAAAASQEDVARLREYHTLLARRMNDLVTDTSVTALVRTTMGLAFLRSTGGAGPEENRAALAAIMFYVNRWPIEAVVPEARSWPRIPQRTFALRGRTDLAQHFITSAAIAAAAGVPLADWAGLYKELSDARGGSGFSFSDLAADRAGRAFGHLATRDHDSARRLQALAGERLAEDDVMPSVAGLADNLSEAEFTRRFGGVSSPKYNEVVAEIDARIAALPLYGQASAALAGDAVTR
jgi:hypothetical protein